MKSKTGWYNKNKLGYSVKHESHRHALASKGIKTSLPKGAKGLRITTTITPNFDMVKKEQILKWKKNLSAVGDNPDYIEEQMTAINIELGRDNPNTSYLRSKIKNMNDWADEIDLAYRRASLKNKKTDMVSGNNDKLKLLRATQFVNKRYPLADNDFKQKKINKLMEKNVKNPKFDMSAGDISDNFFAGASKGKAGNLKIVDTSKTTQLVGYNWAVYGERDKKTGKVTFYKGWDKYSPSTSGQLTKVGLRDKADIIVDKRKEVGFDMSLTSLTKSLKKVSKDVSKTAHNISKKIEEHNIKREADAQKKLDHDIEVAKQKLKLKKMQSKTDLLEMKHKESVQRQRQELARINKELEKGTAKAKAKELSTIAGKKGLKLAGIIAKGVAKEVKEVISTEPPKKKK